MHSCPKCEHSLERIDDFPIIRVVSLDILEIPSGVDFPELDSVSGNLARERLGELIVPREVSDFFGTQTKGKERETFEYGG